MEFKEKFNENNAVEKYSEEPRECIKNKLNEIEKAMRALLNIIKDDEQEKEIAEEAGKIIGKAEQMRAKLDEVKTEQIKNDSHYAHILGQLNAKLCAIPGLKRKKEYHMIVEETVGSINDYLDLNLSNKEYFYSELFARDGYFGNKVIADKDKTVEELNADEFVLISKETLDEDKEQNSA